MPRGDDPQFLIQCTYGNLSAIRGNLSSQADVPYPVAVASPNKLPASPPLLLNSRPTNPLNTPNSHRNGRPRLRRTERTTVPTDVRARETTRETLNVCSSAGDGSRVSRLRKRGGKNLSVRWTVYPSLFNPAYTYP